MSKDYSRARLALANAAGLSWTMSARRTGKSYRVMLERQSGPARTTAQQVATMERAFAKRQRKAALRLEQRRRTLSGQEWARCAIYAIR